MAGFGKVDGGRLVRPPRNGYTAGSIPVSGYGRLVDGDEAFRAAEGWLPVVDTNPPSHDQETHRARRTGWQEGAGEIVPVWEITERPPDPEAGEHLDPQIGEPHA